MSPVNHVGKRLLPSIFLPDIGHNQSASRIIALTFLCLSNESAFFVQRAHPYRNFLHNHIRPNFRVFLRLSRCLEFLQFLHLSDCSYCSDCSYFYRFYAIRRVTILVLITNEQSRSTYIRILSSKNNPSLRYLYLDQRRYYFVWLYKVLEIHNL